MSFYRYVSLLRKWRTAEKLHWTFTDHYQITRYMCFHSGLLFILPAQRVPALLKYSGCICAYHPEEMSHPSYPAQAAPSLSSGPPGQYCMHQRHHSQIRTLQGWWKWSPLHPVGKRQSVNNLHKMKPFQSYALKPAIVWHPTSFDFGLALMVVGGVFGLMVSAEKDEAGNIKMGYCKTTLSQFLDEQFDRIVIPGMSPSVVSSVFSSWRFSAACCWAAKAVSWADCFISDTR